MKVQLRQRPNSVNRLWQKLRTVLRRDEESCDSHATRKKPARSGQAAAWGSREGPKSPPARGLECGDDACGGGSLEARTCLDDDFPWLASTFRIWGTFDPSEILGESRVAIKCAPVKTPNMQAHAFKVETWSILVVSTFIDFIRYLYHAVKPLQLLQEELANTPRNNIENI